MARPTKQGIDYFPLDTDFDEKVEMYLLETEAVGLSVFITILQLIYKNKGYYIEHNNDLNLLIKKRINVDENSVNDCINVCLRRNLFHKSAHDKYKILTSKGIQKRYFDAAKKKKQVNIIPQFLLIGVSGIKNGVNVDGNPINVCGNATNVKVKVNVKEEVNVKEKEKEDVKENVKVDPVELDGSIIIPNENKADDNFNKNKSKKLDNPNKGEVTIPVNVSKKGDNKNNFKTWDFSYKEFIPKQLEGVKGFIFAYDEWIGYRKSIKAKMTELTVKKQLKFLADQTNPIACIEASIRNSWQGLFPESNQKNGVLINQIPKNNNNGNANSHTQMLLKESRING